MFSSVTLSSIRIILGVLNATDSGSIHEQTFDVTRVSIPEFRLYNAQLLKIRF